MRPALSKILMMIVGVGVGLGVVLAGARTPKAAVRTAPSASRLKRLPPPHARKAPTAPAYSPSSYGMSITYYSVRGKQSAVLTLNNKGPHVMNPSVTLYSRGGTAYRVDDLAVEPHTFRTIDLRPLVAAAGPDFEDGSLRVSYVGEIMELGGVVQMTDLDRGVEFYEQLMYPVTPKSTRLEGVWWLPSSAAQARLVVTNTSGSPSVATVTFTGSRGGHHATTVTLGPWQLQTLDWPAAFVGETRTDETGGVSVQYTGNPGAVVAHGLVLDAPARYSAGISLADPGEQVTSRYEGPGVRVAIGHDPLRPVILARNVGAAWSHLEGRLRVTGSDGTLQTFEFPVTDLAPGETHLVDAAAAWRGAAQATTGAAIGIEFSYTTAPGTVVLSVTSVSDTLNQVLATPLSDPGTLASATGGYFFELTRTLDSVVFIKNMTDRPQKYHLFISYDTGSWLPGVKTIAPHETQVVDIAQLRDRHTQDAKGNAIPMDATGGQVHWSILGHTDPKGLVGRMEHVDLTHDVDSTYACTYYGDDYYYDSAIDSVWPYAVAGDTDLPALYTVAEEDSNAYGDSYDGWYDCTDDLTWSSGDSTIATSSGDGTFQGVSTGETYAHVSGEALAPETQDGDDPETIDLSADLFSQAVPDRFQVCTDGSCSSNPIDLGPDQPGSANKPVVGIAVIYSWQSSTNNLADIANCDIYENITYSPSSWPAFYVAPTATFPNQLTGSVLAPLPQAAYRAAYGYVVDSHLTFFQAGSDAWAPSTVTGSQSFSYKCDGGAFSPVTSGTAQSGTQYGSRDIERDTDLVELVGWEFQILHLGHSPHCIVDTDTGVCGS